MTKGVLMSRLVMKQYKTLKAEICIQVLYESGLGIKGSRAKIGLGLDCSALVLGRKASNPCQRQVMMETFYTLDHSLNMSMMVLRSGIIAFRGR
ncbi:hypothetical protein M3J09_003158 [Ascochyta lentis]